MFANKGNQLEEREFPVTAFDHVHHGDRIKAYHFTTAENLLEDFWHDVETFLNAEGIP